MISPDPLSFLALRLIFFYEIVKLLTAHPNTNINIINDRLGQTVLHLACEEGSLEMVKSCLGQATMNQTHTVQDFSLSQINLKLNSSHVSCTPKVINQILPLGRILS